MESCEVATVVDLDISPSDLTEIIDSLLEKKVVILHKYEILARSFSERGRM